MNSADTYEVIIIGGSYAGLQAGLTMGRSSRKTLIIDSGEPCNKNAVYTHNFLTQDSQPLQACTSIALEQLRKYPTVFHLSDTVIKVDRQERGFSVMTKTGNNLIAGKLILATGVQDIFPKVKGFEECWGRTVLHCPYCHGYEVKARKTAIVANGDLANLYTTIMPQWSDNLTLFTNGISTLSNEQREKIKKKNIDIIETEISEIVQTSGNVEKVILKDGRSFAFEIVYWKLPVVVPQWIKDLGCKLNASGVVEVEETTKKTSIPGIYACGDLTSGTTVRTIAVAVEGGMRAGFFLNIEISSESSNL